MEFAKGFMCDALMVAEVKERVASTDKRREWREGGKEKERGVNLNLK
jgi:hypothetical protein